MRIRVMVAVLTVLAGATLAACSKAPLDCGQPGVSMSPQVAVSGGTLAVVVDHSFEECSYQDAFDPGPKNTAWLRLVSLDGKEVATETHVPIGEDASGTATLSLANVSPGTYWIWIDDLQESTIEVVAP